MIHTRGTRALGLFTMLLLCAWHSPAETWEDERYHLSMQQPGDWRPMNAGLIAQTNAQVSHVTGRGFIAGYALRETTTLVFPYMLVQYKPYTALPEEFRPQAKPDERGQLELLYALVGAFRQKGPLPDDIDTPQFIDRFGNNHARLIRLEDDGRFDFAGKIPHEVGQDPIRYHTHGVLGKDGIGLTTIFTIDDYAALTSLISTEMRTLAFAEGYGLAALPDKAVEPVEDLATDPAETPAEPIRPVVDDPAAEADTAPIEAEAEATAQPANPSTGHADSTALVIILILLGVGLVAAALIAWYVAHQKAQTRRERSRARRERIMAGQGTTQASNPPRPATSKARSRGSSDRQKRGTTRS
ncbi:MAG: hypothetical protein KTR15_04565 [Phycisphaeraceae bacterium]|nr:hypothetical protein [Phycisphaeraceae bacterium]